VTSLDIYEEIIRIQRSGGRAALATIVSRKGAAPRKDTAKMLVREDGSMLGSIGGGCVDGEVWQEAMDAIRDGAPRLVNYRLTEKDMAESGLICGGVLDVFIEPITAAPVVHIFGAGHIAQPLSRMAKIAGFGVVVVDDRPTFANTERFPDADSVYSEGFDEAFADLQVNKNSFIVIVTRGHLHDQHVLKWALGTDARYIGMIGSKRKIKTVYKNLQEEGVPEGEFKRVRAPIGMNIGAETPEEIAVSILAEMVQVYKGAAKEA
jgi:xanthine dehydrogenase accessory factor